MYKVKIQNNKSEQKGVVFTDRMIPGTLEYVQSENTEQ